jgi:hypothetical protein
VSLSLILAAAAAAVAAPGPTPAESKLLAELAAACRIPREGLSTDSQVLEYAERLAAPRDPTPDCRRRDPKLALRLARMIASAPSHASGSAYATLADLSERDLGAARDGELARTYRRRAWLLGWGLVPPFETERERDAYLVAPETLDFLRGRIARGAPAKERLRLAEALLARRRPGDVAEARTVLKDPATDTVPSARLLRANLAFEPDATAADVAEASARLRPAAPYVAGGSQARALLLRLGRLQLAQARTAEATWDSVQSLAASAYAGEAEAAQAFRQALKAANGGAEPATIEAVAPRPRYLDFPHSAMRRGATEAVVRLRALVDPRGLIIFTESADPAQPADFLDEVRSSYAANPLPPIALAAPRPTPYVWIAVRPVAFRLSE